MIHPAADLQKAIYSALRANIDLVAALGGIKVFDHNPEKSEFPYIVLGRATSSDWSTSTEGGNEHFLTVHIWSSHAARQEVYSIQQLVKDSLHDTQLVAQDHHIINLRFEFSEIRRDAESRRMHGIMRFRAVTEPKT
jgi:hypothetical protein